MPALVRKLSFVETRLSSLDIRIRRGDDPDEPLRALVNSRNWNNMKEQQANQQMLIFGAIVLSGC